MKLTFETPGTSTIVTMSWCYLLGVLGASIIVRIIMCTLIVWETNAKRPVGIKFRDYFFSRKNVPNDIRDFWHPGILGTLEILVYPLLIASWNLQPIGAWLIFKTATGWKKGWNDRAIYNRFLIGNALVIAVSTLLTLLIKIG